MNKEEFIKRYGVGAWEKKLRYTKDWKNAHLKQVKAVAKTWGKAYYKAHLKQVKTANAAWRKAHPKQAAANEKAWHDVHPKQKGKANQKYRKSEKGKAARKKDEAKRRALGYMELNNHFPNSDGHHIDKIFVIHIPTEMHQSIRHNVFTGRNMEKINLLALDFIYRGKK